MALRNEVKDDILDVVKKWYSDVAELRQLHELVVVMRDNAKKNKSREIKDFFESKGVHTNNGRMDYLNHQSISS